MASPSGITPVSYPEVAYAEIQKPPTAEETQVNRNNPKPSKKPRKPKKDKTQSSDGQAPPVPSKSKELRKDIKSGYLQDDSGHALPPISPHLSQENPLYDGVIYLQGANKQPRSPVHNPDAVFINPPRQSDSRMATSAPQPPPRPHHQIPPTVPEPRPDGNQFVYNNVNFDRSRSRLSHEVRAPTGPEADEEDPMVPIYDMAGPIPATYEDVPLMIQRDVPPQPQHTAPRQPPRASRRQPSGVNRNQSRRAPPPEPIEPEQSKNTASTAHAQSDTPTRTQPSEPSWSEYDRPAMLPDSARSSTRSARSRRTPPVPPINLHNQDHVSAQPNDYDVAILGQKSRNEERSPDMVISCDNSHPEKPNVPKKPTPKPRSRTPDISLYDDPPRSRRPLQRTDAICDSVYDHPRPTNQQQLSPRSGTSAHGIYDDPSADDEVAYGETRAPKTRSRPDVVSVLDSVIVDKRFYNYLCEFWSEQLQPIHNVCELHTAATNDPNSNDIEIRFLNIKRDRGQNLPHDFIKLYQTLTIQLHIENVDMTSIEDMSAYRNELENKFKCLCFTRDSILEVICLKTGLELIKACTEKHRGRSSQSPWPVGFSVADAFSVYLYKADITKLHVDAITNAANEQLRHGGGVAKAIAQAAGPELDRSSREVIKHKKKVPVTHVEKTSPGNLPCRAVLHAVGPQWPKGKREDDQNECRCQVLNTFENVLATADKEGYRSVAIPPISSGVFGVPADIVAQAIVDALLNTAIKLSRPKLREVHIVDINDNVLPQIWSRLDQGELLKTPTGQHVSVSRLPTREVRVATVDQAGYRKMIENNQITGGKSAGKFENFLNKLMCGGGKKNRPR